MSPEAKRIAAAFAPYFDARTRFRLDPEGRAAKHTHWLHEDHEPEWDIAQVLADPVGHDDWEVRFFVPLAESRTQQRAVVRFGGVQVIGT